MGLRNRSIGVVVSHVTYDEQLLNTKRNRYITNETSKHLFGSQSGMSFYTSSASMRAFGGLPDLCVHACRVRDQGQER